ncbi:MAG: hypothetical protein ACI9SE_003883 [Neolewinella sp.]
MSSSASVTLSLGLVAVVFFVGWLFLPDGSDPVSPSAGAVSNPISKAEQVVLPHVDHGTGRGAAQRTEAPILEDSATGVAILVRAAGVAVPSAHLLGLHSRQVPSRKPETLGVANANGEFSLPSKRVGDSGIWVTASLDGFLGEPTYVTSQTRSAVVELLPLYTVDVSCVDHRGHPISAVDVAFSQSGVRKEASPWWPSDAVFSATTDDRGRASIRMPKGAYDASVDHDKYAWVPGGDYIGVEVSAHMSLAFTLVEPMAVSLIVKGEGVSAHSVQMIGMDLMQWYGEECRAQIEKRLVRRNPNGVVGVAIPKHHAQMSARVVVWVPEQGFGFAIYPMKLSRYVEDPVVVDLEDFVFEACEAGSVALRVEGDGAEAVRDLHWTVMKRGGAHIPMFELSLGREVQVPVGNYPVMMPNEPILASLVRGQLGDISVESSKRTEVKVTMPGLRRVRFECRHYKGKRVASAVLSIHGGAVRTRVQLTDGVGDFLCPPGDYKVSGKTGSGDAVSTFEVSILDEDGQVVVANSEAR